VPKVQSLLLMVAWVETPGGGLRGRTGNWDAACVRGKILRLLSFTGVLCGQQARTQRVSAQRITSHVCTIKLSACACVHNWIKRVKQGPSLGPQPLRTARNVSPPRPGRSTNAHGEESQRPLARLTAPLSFVSGSAVQVGASNAPRRSTWRRDANQEAAAPRARAVAHPAAYRRCDEHLHARRPRLLRRGHEPSLIQQRAGTALECVHQERAA